MSRKFSYKNRRERLKKRKPVMLIIAEGRNQTETLYFQSFVNSSSPYSIRMVKGGYKTSPSRLLRKIEDYWDENQLEVMEGDVAFVVLDLDVDSKKEAEIRRLSKESKIVTFIVSNPCFEVWFLMHFRYSTKGYIDGEAVISDLKKYLPNYTKASDVSIVINDLLSDALINVSQLERYYESLEYQWPSVLRNPWTDVHIVINKILGNSRCGKK